MSKRILPLFAFMVLLAAGLWLFQYIQTLKKPLHNTLKVVPKNAAFIVESGQIKKVWTKLSETNVLWEEIQHTHYFKAINEHAAWLDSVSNENKFWNTLIADNRVVISVHMEGTSQFQLFGAINIPPILSDKELLYEFNQLIESGSAKNEQTYKGYPIYKGKLKAIKERVYVSLLDNVLIYSPIKGLITASIDQCFDGQSLLDLPGFKKVKKTAGKHAEANVYMHFDRFHNFLNTYMSSNPQTDIRLFHHFANWSELDLHLLPQSVRFKGITLADSTNAYFLNALSGQAPQKPEITKYLPRNTHYLKYIGLEKPDVYLTELKTYFDRNKRTSFYRKTLDELENTCVCNVQKTFFDWIGNEMVIGGVMEDQLKQYVGIKSLNIEKSEPILKTVSKNTWEIAGKEVHLLPFNNLYKHTLEPQFMGLDSAYWFTHEDYHFFAESMDLAKAMIQQLERKAILAEEPHFNELSENNFSSASNFFIYMDIVPLQPYISTFVNPAFVRELDKYQTSSSKLKTFGLQFKYTGNENLFYTDIFLDFPEEEGAEEGHTPTATEIDLDYEVQGQPQFFTNHYTGAKEVLVQDISNKLYLLDAKGKILWKRQLEHPVLGEIQTVDLFNNGKYQAAFCSGSKVYVIDRNGKDVSPFPAKFKGKASTGLAIFDYENDGNYRFFAGSRDGKLINLDKKGKPTKGWNHKGKGSPVAVLPQHFRIKGKDFIVFSDEKGNTHALDRQGKSRYVVFEKVSPKNIALSKLYKDKNSIEKSYVLYKDRVKLWNRLFFDGQKQLLTIPQELQDSRLTEFDSENQRITLLKDDVVGSFRLNSNKLDTLHIENGKQAFLLPNGSWLTQEGESISLIRQGNKTTIGSGELQRYCKAKRGYLALVTNGKKIKLYPFTL